jgi:oligopeptide transport system substrate-binding protein
MGGRGETGRRSGLKIRFPIGSAGSSPAVRTILMSGIIASVIALAGCSGGNDATVAVSVVGGPARASPELVRATQQGLVAFDESGQIEPALAESWTFTKDGLSVIFRIRRLKWPGGGDVTAADAAASLNASLNDASINRLRPLLSAISGVVAMTDRVVEIRLRVPRPNLLELLAQPEMTITRRGVGTGPWDARPGGDSITLTPRKNADAVEGEDDGVPAIGRIVLRGERAPLAITRFRAQRGGLVTGGTAADWPYVLFAQFRASLVRIDPAQGLFGLAATTARPFIKDDDMRLALAMAIDRNALIAAFNVPNWQPIDRLLPAQFDSAVPPAAADWTSISFTARQADARRRISAWTAARGPLSPLKVALPAGAGMTLLFARIALDWRAIGVRAVRVAWNDNDADLRLIDEVAPNRSANWYLTRTSCDAGLPCNADVDFALKASRAAPDLGRRAEQIGKADAAAARWSAYIPLATPLRWSLVDPALTGFRENSFAVHPLSSLRGP